MAKEEVKILEKGNIYFFYRPKIDVGEGISKKEEVQNFYLVLCPENSKQIRLIIIGQDGFPHSSKKGRFWGFVTRASTSNNQIRKELESYTYDTKTKGKREQPSARPCGEGVYNLVKHGDHTHLVYALELPSRRAAVQKSLNIEKEGNFIVSIKNPEKGSPENVGLSEDQKADFPKYLQQKFRDRKFIPIDPGKFLNYRYGEIVFVSVDKGVKQELGIDLKPEKESEGSADILKELRLDKTENPEEPLFKGKWK